MRRQHAPFPRALTLAAGLLAECGGTEVPSQREATRASAEDTSQSGSDQAAEGM
jgi:hypothetical protein